MRACRSPLSGRRQLGQVVFQGNGFAELDISPAVAFLEEFPGIDQLAHRFRFFLPALQFLEVGFFLQHLVIADEGGDKENIGSGPFVVGPEDHVEQPQLGQHQFTGAAASPLDEKLEVVAGLDQGLDVGVEDLGIEFAAQEPAPDEKGPGAPEDGAQGPEGQVLARGDAGGLHVMLEDEVVEDEVVQMAFVAGHEDQAAPLAGLPHFFKPLGVKGNAVKQVPGQPIYQAMHGADIKNVGVGGDLPKVILGRLLDLGELLLFGFRQMLHGAGQGRDR